jgi:hypothetical protein
VYVVVVFDVMVSVTVSNEGSYVPVTDAILSDFAESPTVIVAPFLTLPAVIPDVTTALMVCCPVRYWPD